MLLSLKTVKQDFLYNIKDEYTGIEAVITANLSEAARVCIVLMLHSASTEFIGDNGHFLNYTELSVLNGETYVNLHYLSYTELLELVSFTRCLDNLVLYEAFYDYTIWRECFDKPEVSLIDRGLDFFC